MSKKTSSKFAICVKNGGYPASLEKRKLYETLSDPDAAKCDELRVIDESGEDYLYSEEYFVQIALPKAIVEKVIGTE